MCFSHQFATTDLDAVNISDLKFVLSRIEIVAVQEGIANSQDSLLLRKLKVAAVVKSTPDLPSDFKLSTIRVSPVEILSR